MKSVFHVFVPFFRWDWYLAPWLEDFAFEPLSLVPATVLAHSHTVFPSLFLPDSSIHFSLSDDVLSCPARFSDFGRDFSNVCLVPTICRLAMFFCASLFHVPSLRHGSLGPLFAAKCFLASLWISCLAWEPSCFNILPHPSPFDALPPLRRPTAERSFLNCTLPLGCPPHVSVRSAIL